MNHLHRSLSGLVALGLVMTASTAFAKGNVDGALKFVPSDFSTVVAFDLDALRASPLFDVVKTAVKDDREMKEVQKATGLDPLKDIKSMVIAGPDQFIKDEGKFVAVLEAKFDEKKIVDFMKSQGQVTEKDAPGGKLYVIEDGGVAFRGDYLVAGPMGLVEKALAAGKGIPGGKLAKMYGSMKGAKGGFVLLGGSEQLKKWLAKRSGKGGPDFKDIEAMGVAVDLSGGGLGVEMHAAFASDKSASDLAAGVSAAAKEAAGDPDMKELGLAGPISKVSATAKGKEAVVAVKLAKDDMKTITEMLKEMVSGK
ncbi:MAG: hypothetical protein KC635_00240 [Myxococcales bacterium]|nr:hypothetical protein [Myxococcales bacterium]MCB9731121.1 hypothetical protein [Deltaproteobacteria bacterium]